MSCRRCAGLLQAVILADEEFRLPMWHCLLCGSYTNRKEARCLPTYQKIANYRQRHLSQGLCECCPQPRDPRSATLCTWHLIKRRSRQRRWHQHHDGFQPWQPGGKGRPPLIASLGLILACLLFWPLSGAAHTGTLDAYGCHSNKALYGTTAKRECHQDLLTGQVFTSLQAELKAYIAAQKTQNAQLTTKLAEYEARCPAPPPPPPPPVIAPATVTGIALDATGATLTITGPGQVLEFVYNVQPNFVPIVPFVPGTASFRHDFLWPSGTTFACYRTKGTDGIYTEQACGPVTPATPPPVVGSASLTWIQSLSADVVSNRVYVGTAPGVYGAPVLIGKQTTYTVTNLLAGQTYYFVVTARDAAGNESGFSNEVSKAVF